jgi:hypothetical protein
MQKIASTALSMNRGDYLEMVTEKHMKLTQHDCYKTVTQRVQEKCFDLQVCYLKKYLFYFEYFFLE